MKIPSNHNYIIWLISASLLLTFLSLTRLTYLSVIPPSLTHDEIMYASQAKSYALQGKSLDQKNSIWQLRPAHPMYAEIPALLLTPFFMAISDPLLATRAFSGLMGIAFPFVFGWFVYGLLRHRRLAYISIMIAAVNPLLWQFSHLYYDAVLSTFFYLLAAALILNSRSWWKLSSLPFLFLGFFCYQGYKPLIIPWLLLILFVDIYHQKTQKLKATKPHILILVFLLCLITSYLFLILPHQNVENRLQNTLIGNLDVTSDWVNTERRLSLNSPFTSVVSNKLTLAFQFIIKRFFNAFSLNMLFVQGEPTASGFAVWSHGFYYVFDFFLIIFGLVVGLGRKRWRFSSFLIGGFICLAVLPALITVTSEWYLLRSFFAYILLLVFVSLGFFRLFYSKARYVLIFIYLFFILNFAYQFYYRYPVLGADKAFISERIVIEYIRRLHQQNPTQSVSVHTVDPLVLTYSYLLYSEKFTSKASLADFKNLDNVSNQIGPVRITSDCLNPNDTRSVMFTESWRGLCPDSSASISAHPLTIASLLDSGAKLRLYHDKLCQPYRLNRFMQVKSLKELDINQLTNEAFCTRYILNID